MRNRSLHIGYTIDDCLAIEDDSWIAIHAILHRLGQSHRGALHPRTIFLTQLLEALQNDSFGLFRIGRKTLRQSRFSTPDAIQFIDMEFCLPMKYLTIGTDLTYYRHVSRSEYLDDVRIHLYWSTRLCNTSKKDQYNPYRHNKAY